MRLTHSERVLALGGVNGVRQGLFETLGRDLLDLVRDFGVGGVSGVRGTLQRGEHNVAPPQAGRCAPDRAGWCC